MGLFLLLYKYNIYPFDFKLKITYNDTNSFLLHTIYLTKNNSLKLLTVSMIS